MTGKERTTREMVTIFGRPLELRNETRSVDELRLDPLNPRLRHEQVALEADGMTLTEAQIRKLLWSKEDVKRLYRAIVASRGLSEPLHITENGRTVEGNERLVALLKIAENTDQGHFTGDEKDALSDLVRHVPCKILPSDITQAEIDVFLARLHVSGKHEWPALNQAAHIHKLAEEDGLTVEQISEILGKSKPWVYQKLQAFSWTEAYLRSFGDDKIHDYSYFEELYKVRKKLRDLDFDVDERETMDVFHRLVASRDLGGALEVRKLPKLLRNDETRDHMLGGRGRKAINMLIDVEPSEFSPRFAAIQKALDQFPKMTREDIAMIRDHKRYRVLLEDLRTEIDDILEQVKVGG